MSRIFGPQAVVSVAPAVRIGCAVLLALIPSGCGDAYSSHVPEQKVSSELVLLPDNSRVGETLQLHVVVYAPTATNYISEFDFGEGLEVLDFDTGGGTGCSEVVLEGIPEGEVFEPTHQFPVCMTLVIQSTASLGARDVSVDVESGGTPIVARGTFYVLPEAPFQE